MTPTQIPEPAAVPAPPPARPDTPAADGDIVLTLTPESVAYLADRAWADEAHNAGLLAAYPDAYVAIYGRAIRGHGPDPIRLREEVARDHNFDPGKIVVTYVAPPFEC